MSGVKRARNGGTRDAYVKSMDERGSETFDFVKNLKFSVPLWKVHNVDDRRPCPKCGKRRQFYCYDCLAITHPETHPAPVKLPLNVNVLFHPGEHRSKATSLAAATISPQVSIHEYPSIPEGLDASNTLVLYPSEDSVTIDEIEDIADYKTVVFIDATWNQSKKIARDERVCKMKKVRIHTQVSLFWRYQNNDPSYLATVEAIYYTLREIQTALNRRLTPSLPYGGEVDDILLYYVHQYIKVQKAYTTASAKRQAAIQAEKGSDNKTEEKPEEEAPAEEEVAEEKSKEFTKRHFTGYIIKGADWESLVATPADAQQ